MTRQCTLATRLRLRSAGLLVVPALLLASLSLAAPSLAAHAQGILTVSPAGTMGTIAGTGTVGYTGNGAAATAATLAAPSAVAYDALGNLYLADTRNHAIRKIDTSGNITTVAGIGVAGFGGDGAAATAALLDTPTGIAVDAAGNLYIADSRNNRIRKVTAANGFISSIAGTGTAGFSGDGSAPTSAMLALPSAVAVTSDGSVVYIADTNNNRVRGISGGQITTLIGSGVQGYTGDGGAATSAALDTPTGVAIDSLGNIYVADRHNQRVREEVAGTGNLSTIAGSGAVTFSGSFSGDGATATAATLSRPTGVAVDIAGNIYITDTENHRIREISGTTIATVAGNGVQGSAGDTNVPTAANLNSPRAVALDANGDVVIADKLNNKVREASLATLVYSNQTVNTTSTGKTLTLFNTGTASITVSAVTYSGPFTTVSGGTCSTLPITITAGNNCTVLVAFAPTTVAGFNGSVTFSGSSVVSSKTLLSGTSTAVVPTQLVYTASPATPIVTGGNAGTVIVKLEDGSGNIATSNSTTVVTLTVTGPSSYSQTYTATAASGVATFNLATPALTAAGTYTYTASATGLTSAVATEAVEGPPTITESFAANPVAPGAVTSVVFTLGNPSGNPNTLTGLAFTDTLPSGITVFSSPGASTTCAGGTIAATGGSSSISFSGGTLPPGGTCTVSVQVGSPGPGNYVNTSSAVTSANGGTGGTATATLVVSTTRAITVQNQTVVSGYATGILANAIYTGSTPPSGAVTFAINGTTTGTLTCTNKNGHSNCTTNYTATGLAAGNYTLTVSQAADSNYVAATGSATLTVSATIPTNTTVSVSSNSSPVNTPLTITATLVSATGTTTAGTQAGPNPTGTVTFYATRSGTTTNIGAVAANNGAATLSYAPTVAGSYTFTAVYNPSGNFSSSADNTGQVVSVQ